MNVITQYGWQLSSMLTLLAASGFFSGTETALFSLSRRDLHILNQSVSGRTAAKLLDNPNSLLTVLLLSNMVVNVAFSAIAATLIIKVSDSGADAWIVAMVSLVPLLALILIGEVTPKMLAYSASRSWSRTAGIPVSLICRLLGPVITILDTIVISPLSRIISPTSPQNSDISSEELSALMEISTKRGSVPRDTGAMLQEIVELTDLKVCDIMVPRVDMITCDIGNEAEAVVELFGNTGLRKIPVHDGENARIIGVINARELLLNPQASLRQLLRPAMFIPELATLDKALVQFRVTKNQMAIAVDEYGSTAGLVTVEDIIEEIVGDIQDRHEIGQPPPVSKCGDDEYIVSGDLAIHDWAGAFGIEESVGRRIHTLGGLVTSLIGRIPRVGDSTRWKNLAMTVESVDGRRIGSIRLHLGEVDK